MDCKHLSKTATGVSSTDSSVVAPKRRGLVTPVYVDEFKCDSCGESFWYPKSQVFRLGIPLNYMAKKKRTKEIEQEQKKSDLGEPISKGTIAVR